MTKNTPYQSPSLSFLSQRGLIQDISLHLDTYLAAHPNNAAAYVGIDPTASAIHVGNLATLMLLARLARHGVRPVVLLGEATALVGDPSGKSSARLLMSPEVIEANAASIREQVASLFQAFVPGVSVEILSNSAWLQPMGFIDFLRKVGVHFPLNMMLAKDSVKRRLETGISFTEFSYQLCQAYDFYKLHQQGVHIQLGGADQWGNITAGIEYVRRRVQQAAHGLTTPLLTDAVGNKLGKTAAGTTIWLDPKQTSPYQFYQYWLNQTDDSIPQLMATFMDEIDLTQDVRVHKTVLARWLIERVHGVLAAKNVIEATQILFSKASDLPSDHVASPRAYEVLRKEIPSYVLNSLDSVTFFTVLENAFPSRSEMRRVVQQGGVSVNGSRISSDQLQDQASPVHGKYYLIRRGKKAYTLVVQQGN